VRLPFSARLQGGSSRLFLAPREERPSPWGWSQGEEIAAPACAAEPRCSSRLMLVDPV
jgi:hypothetical protein